MYKFKQSLLAFAGLLALVSAIAFLTPRTGLGQKPSPLPPSQNVNVVNNPPVQASDLYPARPFQKLLVPRPGEIPGRLEDCTTVPADSGLIIELVTMTAQSLSASGHLVVELRTIAGGEDVGHIIPLERQVIGSNLTSLAVTQPLRAYADPGTELCIRRVSSGGELQALNATISGQLAPVAPSPAAPAQ